MPSFVGTSGTSRKVTIFLEDNTSQVLTLDASVIENHSGNAVVTDYPVELGADITDHIRREHERLSIQGVVSNFPIVIGGPALANPSVTGGSRTRRAEDAYDFLNGAKNSGKLVGVSTTLRDYRSMAIISLGVTRDKDSGNIVNLSLTFREVITSNTENVDVKEPVNASRKDESQLGRKQKTESSSSVNAKAESTLDKALAGQESALSAAAG